jgi:post-segregation antitoxin (ccd killing protein)
MLESAAMPKTRISVTVERALLDEFKEAAGKDAQLSALVSEALRREIRRLGMLALLDEMERKNPISAEGRAAGERLWQAIESSSIPGRSRRSPKKAKHSASRSGKR